jgi:hypothetical protein
MQRPFGMSQRTVLIVVMVLVVIGVAFFVRQTIRKALPTLAQMPDGNGLSKAHLPTEAELQEFYRPWDRPEGFVQLTPETRIENYQVLSSAFEAALQDQSLEGKAELQQEAVAMAKRVIEGPSLQESIEHYRQSGLNITSKMMWELEPYFDKGRSFLRDPKILPDSATFHVIYDRGRPTPITSLGISAAFSVVPSPQW